MPADRLPGFSGRRDAAWESGSPGSHGFGSAVSHFFINPSIREEAHRRRVSGRQQTASRGGGNGGSGNRNKNLRAT
jgi:hypothetical protein